MKRIISLSLSILMILTLLPFNAWALELKSSDAIILEESEIAEEFPLPEESENEEESVFEEILPEEGEGPLPETPEEEIPAEGEITEPESLPEADAEINASSGTCGENLAWELDYDGVLTISGSGAMDDYTFGKAPWYSYQKEIKTLVLCEGITHIGNYAFRNLHYIRELNIPSTVKSIGKNAFEGAEDFNGALVLPSGLESIGEYAFRGCVFPGDLVIPDSVTSVESYAFSFLPSTEHGKIIIGSGLTSIAVGAFKGGNFTEIVLKGDIETISTYAFSDNERMEGELVFSEALKEIGAGAFYNCGINEYYFEGDAPTVPYSGGNGSLSSFDSDDTIYYPYGNATWTSNNVFYGYRKKAWVPGRPDLLANGTCGENLEWELSNEGVLTISGSGAMEDYNYSGSAPWNSFKDTIKSVVLGKDIASIGSYAFYNYSSLAGNLIIPDGLKVIGKYAFYNCSGLTGNLVIPDSVTGVGEYAFNGCSGFDGSLVIGSGLAEIKICTFTNTSGLSGSVTIPKEITKIGLSAFKGCGIKEYYFEGDAPSVSSATASSPSFDSDVTIHYDINADGWGGKWNGYSAKPTDENYITSGSCGTDVRWKLDINGVLTIYGTGKMSNYGFRTVNDVRVCGASWWGYADSITSVVIEEGVESIGNYAFTEMVNIQGSIIMPESMTSIGDYAFYHCGVNEYYFTGNAPSVYKPGTYPYDNQNSFDFGADTIFYPFGNSTWTLSNGKWNGYTAKYCFQDRPDLLDAGYCGGEGDGTNLMWELNKEGVLTISGTGTMADYSNSNPAPWNGYSESMNKLVIEEGVESLGISAFKDCIGLTGGLVIPESVTSIGNSAFSGCRGFDGNLVLPDKLTYIGSEAFYNCKGFTGDLTIPGGITSIGTMAFNGCTGFYGKLILPENLISINFYAFGSCGFTGDLIIPETTRFIGEYAFMGCKGFDGELILPEGITSISSQAFYDCSGFTGSVIIPSSVTKIGERVFKNCGFSDYYFKGDAPTVSAATESYPSFDSSDTLYYQKDNSTWIVTNGKWNGYSVGIWDENAVAMGYCGAEGDGTNLEWYYGRNGVLTISGTGAMANYSNANPAPWADYRSEMKELVIESGVTTIGDFAFAYCEGFTCELSIPETVTEIGTFAFAACVGFEGNLVIPESVTKISASAFDCCFNLKGTLTLPSRITSIPNRAFYATGFTGELIIPEGVTLIGGEAFYATVFEGSVTIPSSVKTIEYRAFRYSAVNDYYFEGEAPLVNRADADPSAGMGSGSFDGDADIIHYISSAGGWNIDENGKWRGYKTESRDGEILLSGYCGGEGDGTNLTWELTRGGTLIISGEGKMATYSEKKVNGKYITTAPWSDYADELTSLVIKNGVTSIGYSAFYGCSNFTGNLIIPDSVTSIGSYAFYGCSGFNGNLTFGNSITSIGSYAFYECSGFTRSLTMPDSVKSIGNEAFRDCGINEYYFKGNAPTVSTTTATNSTFDYTDIIYFDSSKWGWKITATGGWNGYTAYATNRSGKCGNTINLDFEINLSWVLDENGVLTISGSGLMADYDYYDVSPWYTFRSEIKSIVLDEKITSIGAYAFYNCSSAAGSLTIPDGVTTIGDSAFENCSGFTGNLAIPNGVTTIGDFAFQNCSGLTGSLAIPNGVTTIGRYVFDGCSGFNGSLTIPGNVTTIGNRAFYNCSGFTGSLTIPNSVTTIGDYAFRGCGINEYYFKENAPTVSSTSEDFPVFDSADTIYFDSSKSGWAIDADGKWNGGTAFATNRSGKCGTNLNWELDENGVLTISGSGLMAYYDYNDVSPWYTFRREIKSIVLDERITSIGAYAFYDCSSAAGNLIIPDGVTTIGMFAFYNCSGFTGSLSIGNSVTSIKEYAFKNCSGFTGSLTIPDSVESIEYRAFLDCGINEYYFKGNAPSICDIESIASFDYTDIIYFDSSKSGWDVDTSGKWKIYKAYATNRSGKCGTNLNWELDENGVLTISGSGAMTGYSSSSVSPWYTFRSEIKSIVLDGKITSVGDYAFYNCSSAAGSLTIPNGVTSIGKCAFRGCGINEYYFNGSAPSVTSANSSASTFDSSDTIYYIVGDSSWVISGGKWNGYTAKPLIKGYCGAEGDGTNLEWVLSSEGVLTISGTGAMKNYSIKQVGEGNDAKIITNAEWGNYIDRITAVVFENGVSTIGNMAFRGISTFSRVDIPATVTSIGFYAFRDCSGLKEVHFSGNAPSVTAANVNTASFDDTITVYYPENNATWKITGGKWNGYTAQGYKPVCVEHSYGNWYVVVAATCTEKGEERHDCKNCGYYEILETEKNPDNHGNHGTVTKNQETANCEKGGYTGDIHCKGCDKLLQSGTVIEKAAHKMGDWYEAAAATCTEKGEERRDCENCEYSEIKEIKAKGHSYEDTLTAPTCTEKGFTTHTCSECEDSYTDSYVDASGHSFGDWYETEAATCTEKGEECRDCENCEHSETKEVKAKGHNYVDDVCSECGEEKPEVTIIYGDVDGNGKVNVIDANLIRRYAAKLITLTEEQLLAADVDGNGKVNVIDANLIRRFAAKLIDKFPVEK